jgi:hypothetical protein
MFTELLTSSMLTRSSRPPQKPNRLGWSAQRNAWIDTRLAGEEAKSLLELRISNFGCGFQSHGAKIQRDEGQEWTPLNDRFLYHGLLFIFLAQSEFRNPKFVII